ncbi:hypothetical protein Tco_1220346 [Tanacetum coccineum]
MAYCLGRIDRCGPMAKALTASCQMQQGMPSKGRCGGVDWAVLRYDLLRMLRGRQSLLTLNFLKVNHSMLERSTGIAGVTEATLGPELVPSGGKDQQSRTASPLRRQGPAGQEQLVSSGGKDQPTSGPQQVLKHEDNFDPEDKPKRRRSSSGAAKDQG